MLGTKLFFLRAGQTQFFMNMCSIPRQTSGTTNFTFDGLNGYAAPSTFVSGGMNEVFGVESGAQIQTWWRNDDENAYDTTSGNWVKGSSATAPSIYANSSTVVPWISYRLFYQETNGSISSLAYTGDRREKAWDTQPMMAGIHAVLGSAIAVTSDGNPGDLMNMFVQVNGSDITQFSGGGSHWKQMEALPVD